MVFRPVMLLSVLLHGAVVFMPWTSSQERPDNEIDVSLQITPNSPPLQEPDPTNPLADDPDVSPAPVSEPLPSEAPLPNAPAPLQPPPPSIERERQNNAPPRPSEFDEPLAPVLPTNDPLPFSAFPHPDEGQTCSSGLNNCRQIQGGSFRQIGSSLTQELTNSGFEVVEEDGVSDYAKVYRVTQADTTQYLSVLPGPQGGAIYILAADPITSATSLEEEMALVDANFDAIIQQVEEIQPARTTDFPFPEFFFNDAVPRSEVSSMFYVLKDVNQVSVSLTRDLVTRNFKVDQIGEYAGAPIYQISQGAFVAYLSVLPTQDEAGTLLVTWNRLPE
jgi:hypothetical protein